MSDDAVRRRPGGRTARVRADVHQATIDLLSERRWDELSIPAIAKHSGVHQATIYRRWASLGPLLDDVITEYLGETSPVPDTGTVRGDVEGWAVKVAADVAGPMGVVFLRAAALGTRGDTQQPYMTRRGQQLTALIERGRERGEPVPTLLELVELILAPLYYHALFFNKPATADHARKLVDRLMDVIEPG